nr:AEL_HP1_G0031020.mRNA.1.CDS.1 [Saccharomyces cerevisiae]
MFKPPTQLKPTRLKLLETVFNYGDFTTMLTSIAPDQMTRMIHRCSMVLQQIKTTISSALSKDSIYTIAN